MTPATLALASVRVDGTTQARRATNEALVMEYADRMAAGDVFPPVDLFFDGVTYHVGDGNHRLLAAQRLGLDAIAVLVHGGTQVDALWFALGANRTHGERLTGADRKHAIKVAIQAFPERSGAEIARHIGCSHQWVSDVKNELRAELQASCSLPDQVVGADGRHYPATRLMGNDPHPQTAEIVTRLKAGESGETIAKGLKVSSRTVARIRESAGMAAYDRTPAAVARRTETIRTMAAEGYTSRQIQAAVGLSLERLHFIAKREAIDIPADRVVGKTQRHNSTRIVSRIVMAAEMLTDGVELVNFADLDPTQIPDWLRGLKACRDNLGVFIRRLMQEQQHHGETDQPQAVEDPSGPDRAHARAAALGDAATVPPRAR
jgi:hypothetical protein